MKKLGFFVAVLFIVSIFFGMSLAAEKKETKPAGPKNNCRIWTAIGGKDPLKARNWPQLEIYQKGDTYEGKYRKATSTQVLPLWYKMYDFVPVKEKISPSMEW